MKKYTLSIPFVGSSCKYTLTGGDADASFSPSFGFAAMATETERSGKEVKVPCVNSLHITKARVVSTGAPGVVSGGPIAASIDLRFIVNTSGGDVNEDVNVTLNRWNEWEDKDVFVAPVKEGDLFNIKVQASSELFVHDFNVQTDYIGAELVPTLELEVESDFLVADDTNV